MGAEVGDAYCHCEFQRHLLTGLTVDGYVACCTWDADQSDGIQARLRGEGQSCRQRLKLHSRCQQTLNNRERRDKKNTGKLREFEKDHSNEE